MMQVRETKHYSADGKLKWIDPPQDNTIKEKFPDAEFIGYEKQDIEEWHNKGFFLQIDEYGNYFAVPFENMRSYVMKKAAAKTVSDINDRINDFAWNGDSE